MSFDNFQWRKVKKKFDYTILFNIGFTIINICFIIGILVLIISQMGIEIQQANSLTYEKCCGGYVCSDIYYDLETETCKLVFEENYYPWNIPNLFLILIVFGVALILAFLVTYIIPREYEY